MIMTKVRLWFYLASGVIASIVPVLLTLGVLTEGQGNSLVTAIGSIGSLIGAGGAITAGTVLNRQVKSGTVGATPVDQVINNIPVVVEQAQQAAKNLDMIRKVTTDALNTITASPVDVGPLAKQVIEEIDKALP